LTLAWGGSRRMVIHVYFLNTDRAATLIHQAARVWLTAASATRPPLFDRYPIWPLFDRYRVDRLLTNGTELGQSPLYNPLLEAAMNAETPIHPAQAGETILIEDGVRLEILHPGPERHPDHHENAVALRLVYGDFALLLPGPVGEWGQAQILARGVPLDALVLRLDRGVSEGWVTAVQPQIIIANSDTESWHAPALRLDELGTIHLTTDGRQIWLEALRR
jgi:beta-lactamase superfamily II metal-dependent hydrolase